MNISEEKTMSMGVSEKLFSLLHPAQFINNIFSFLLSCLRTKVLQVC